MTGPHPTLAAALAPFAPKTERMMQKKDTALAAALSRIALSANIDTQIEFFTRELERNGFMVVPNDYRENGIEAGLFFSPPDIDCPWDDWHDLILEGDFDYSKPIEIGRLVKLAPKFAVRIPTSEDGDYEIDLYDTLAEAEAMAKSVYGDATP